MRIQSTKQQGAAILVLIVASTILLNRSIAQQPAGEQRQMVQLRLRGGVQLKALIDYVGTRLGISFSYDEEIGERSVNVRAPGEIPVDSLLDLLGSVLRIEELVLVESDTQNLLRIVEAETDSMARLADPRPSEQRLTSPATPVTEIFVLERANPQDLVTVLRPFLTQPGGNTVALEDSGTLIITDYPKIVENASVLIEMLDKGPAKSDVRYYQVLNADVGKLVENVTALLPSTRIKLVGESRTRLIAVVGDQQGVEQAMSLLERFDVAVKRTVKVYRFKNIQAERVEKILNGLFQGEEWAGDSPYSITSDAEANLIVVRATPDVHRIFDNIVEELDQPTDNPSTPIRFYKLQNAKAIEVFYTLQALQELSGPSLAAYGQFGAYPLGGMNGFSPFGAGMSPFGPSLSGLGTLGLGGRTLPRANGMRAGLPTNRVDSGFENTALPLQPNAPPGMNSQSASQNRVDQLSDAATSQLSATGAIASLPGGARVSVDIASNSLIVVAPTEVHRMYEQIIKKLDIRRPQVLIQAHIVAVDTSDRFQLGVEYSGGDRTGAGKLFNFTSFGLSEVDPSNGFLSLNPGLGFNGVLVDPDVADVIISALATHSRAQVLASPQILVNDNSTGELRSEVSIPFESVNASNTVSTTSLGGNQSAGTIISVTPQINEGNHLQLGFSVEFSTFVDDTTAGALPPPRQIDSVASQVTIPNGHTVIVGGLNRSGDADEFTGVPFLEKIPILRELSSLKGERSTTTSFFLFIRPVVLRDDKFRDLKHFSNKSMQANGVRGEYPLSEPIMMK